MDGRLITEMRTAVTKRLASPASRILARLGSGVQAKAHLEALSGVRASSTLGASPRSTAEPARTSS